MYHLLTDKNIAWKLIPHLHMHNVGVHLEIESSFRSIKPYDCTRTKGLVTLRVTIGYGGLKQVITSEHK